MATIPSISRAFMLQRISSPHVTTKLRGVASYSSSSSSDHVTSTKQRVLTPLVVCGPSGVGKGTIISRFMEANQSKLSSNSNLPKFEFSVSHTTRNPRNGEIDGVHYHFTTKEYMQNKIDRGGFFIEFAHVHGNMYGTSFQSILDASAGPNQHCLLDIDVKGVRSIKKFQDEQARCHQLETTIEPSLPDLQAKFIFIAPPSIDVLYDRLLGRGSETPESLQRRFQNAKAEIEYGTKQGNFDAIIVNDNLDMACQEFDDAVCNMYMLN